MLTKQTVQVNRVQEKNLKKKNVHQTFKPRPDEGVTQSSLVDTIIITS